MIFKTIIVTLIGLIIVALHIYRECKWFDSLTDEDAYRAMKVARRIQEEYKDRW